MQVHGSIPYAELRTLGLTPEDIIDFSATVNPFPIPDLIYKTISSVSLSAYPDPRAYRAISAISEFYDLPNDWCTVTTGMTEPIFILPRLFSSAAYFAPSYGDYRAAFKRYHQSLSELSIDDDGAWVRVFDSLRTLKPDVLLICNPNNPDGTYIAPETIEALCRAFPDMTLYCDESYQEMGEACESAAKLVRRYRNLLVAKSLTKPFGIGGIRVAYLLGSGPVLDQIRSWLIPWGVSLIAQTIVPVLFSLRSLYQEQWEKIIKEKRKLVHELSALGYTVNRSRAPYVLVNTGDATATRKHLLEKYRFHVRDCTSFGMSDTIRVMPQLPEENNRLLESIGKFG